MNFVFRISTVLPPRTPPKCRKIFCLGFRRKSHRSLYSTRWVRIWNRNFKFRTGSRVIRVWRSFYYVNLHIFAFRAPMLPLSIVLKAGSVFPVTWPMCTAILVVLASFLFFCYTLMPFRIFAPGAFSSASRVSRSFFRQFASQTLIVWGGCS